MSKHTRGQSSQNFNRHLSPVASSSPKTIVFVYHVVVCVKSLQSCLTLCNSMDCSPSGSSVHGIIQVRILEWVLMTSSRGSSPPSDRSHISCIGKRVLYHLGHLGRPNHIVDLMLKGWLFKLHLPSRLSLSICLSLQMLTLKQILLKDFSLFLFFPVYFQCRLNYH